MQEGQEVTIILPDRDRQGFIQAETCSSAMVLIVGVGFRDLKKVKADVPRGRDREARICN